MRQTCNIKHSIYKNLTVRVPIKAQNSQQPGIELVVPVFFLMTIQN